MAWQLLASCSMSLLFLISVQLLQLGNSYRADSFLTPYMLSKSIVNHGDMRLYHSVNDKLKAKKCLNITGFGGSVTKGAHIHGWIPHEETWPYQAAKQLNKLFPCNGSHTALNIAVGGVQANYWVELFAGTVEELLGDADIVMVETAVNDVSEGVHIAQEAEVLMSMIMRAANYSGVSSGGRLLTGIAPLWVTASTRRTLPTWTGVPFQRESDGMYAQLPVAQHHGVPMVSIINALGPFPSLESQAWFNATWYQDDPVHPSVFGHELIGHCIAHFIRLQYSEYMAGVPALRSGAYQPRPPIYNEERIIDMYLSDRPVSIYLLFQDKFNLRKASECKLWRAMVDPRNGKNGLICQDIGVPCTVFVTPSEVQRLKLGEVHVQALKSYETVGAFNITITTRPAAADGNCTKVDGDDPGLGQYLGSYVFDGLWQHRVSEVATEEFTIDLPANRVGQCMYITLTLLERQRTSNLAKITGLMLY